MDPAIAHAGSREKLLGAAPDAAREALYSPERHIRPAQPPLFLLHAEDDDVVKVENSVRLRAATRASGAPCESHFFERGGRSAEHTSELQYLMRSSYAVFWFDK